jgi:hypothetical protein
VIESSLPWYSQTRSGVSLPRLHEAGRRGFKEPDAKSKKHANQTERAEQDRRAPHHHQPNPGDNNVQCGAFSCLIDTVQRRTGADLRS